MSGRTPRPWAATTRQGSWDWVVYQVSDPNIEVCQTFHDGTEMNERGEANAKLIAAAPDLLDALKAYIDQCCEVGESRTWLELKTLRAQMRAAIAKAEGSS